ncbi:hypothetical protein ES703_94809 [subsurface metagenome]
MAEVPFGELPEATRRDIEEELDTAERRWGELLGAQIDQDLSLATNVRDIETLRRRVMSEYLAARRIRGVTERVRSLRAVGEARGHWEEADRLRIDARTTIRGNSLTLDRISDRIAAIKRRMGVE